MLTTEFSGNEEQQLYSDQSLNDDNDSPPPFPNTNRFVSI